ncbi:RAMP superfamily CRISPR-associated protein [Methanosphaera cuniculi]|uniref:RAMP superfamily protein n=1 Tax=Methanosphaera cuniculi TaxID=1077256 RepID=A0A2A2HDY0_9EURY|nr:RAMP superfamily CRISPR-associated protein [Methanosphaera cuniculi]PAV07530.1 hypothetical protein ASJ82_07590 [Methanosphaera cuniculi]PWL08154.1 RAMP superfamily protein [Methanosphaera cuniculi]
METITIKGNWTALSPIHHGGSENYGTTKLIHTLPTLVTNALSGEPEIENIPYIHGNAIRGMLRRLIMEDYLSTLNYQLDSKKVYHFLFTGGILEALDKKDKGAINLTTKKSIRKYIPPISLLGSALGNQMIQGKLKVGMGNLVCTETKQYIADTCDNKFSAYNLKATDFGTRLDDLEIGKQILENNDTEKPKDTDTQNNQMKYEFETIIRGARFTHEFILEDMLEHEKGCFKRMIELWQQRPYLGGKSNAGYGMIKLEYNKINELDSSSYTDYLTDNREDIVEFLEDLCKQFR